MGLIVRQAQRAGDGADAQHLVDIAPTAQAKVRQL
jgi:hypothetical protein